MRRLSDHALTYKKKWAVGVNNDLLHSGKCVFSIYSFYSVNYKGKWFSDSSCIHLFHVRFNIHIFLCKKMGARKSLKRQFKLSLSDKSQHTLRGSLESVYRSGHKCSSHKIIIWPDLWVCLFANSFCTHYTQNHPVNYLWFFFLLLNYSQFKIIPRSIDWC